MSGAKADRGVRDWLPIEAATGPRVRNALEEAVDAWSGKWFAGARAEIAAVEARAAGAPQVAGGWLLHGDAVAVPADGLDTIRVAGLALGADAENLVLSEPDRDIIGRLAATIADDLAARLCVALGREQPAPGAAVPRDDPLDGDAGIALRISDTQGRPLTQASVRLAALVPFLKAGIKTGKNTPSLARITRAIEKTATRIDVRLGETRLTLGELSGLARGDVLVLDRPIDDGATLALDGRLFASAGLEWLGDTTRLILSHEPRDI